MTITNSCWVSSEYKTEINKLKNVLIDILTVAR